MGRWVLSGLGSTACLHRPPTPTRNPPWRGIRFAPPCRRIRAGLRPSGSRCRGWMGGQVLGWVGGYGLFTPPRPPPPVILPGAAFASLCLAGASRRASPFGLALPRVLGGQVLGWVGGYGLFTPPRPPPPVILPGAAVASLRLAGAFAPGFALRARAAAGVGGSGLGFDGTP